MLVIRVLAFSAFFIGIQFETYAQESGWYVDAMGKLAGHIAEIIMYALKAGIIKGFDIK